MRKWIPVALIVLAVAVYAALNIGSSMALSDAVARPILALTQADQRIPVQQPGQPTATGAAQLRGGQGIPFGYRFTFALPDGSLVTCSHRFHSLACDGGWQAERAPADQAPR
jgi:hypothetical protein